MLMAKVELIVYCSFASKALPTELLAHWNNCIGTTFPVTTRFIAFILTIFMFKSRLIINADDLGVNAQRSHGIFQCVEFGVVSSVSLYPNGTDSDSAARKCREREISAGLHINITEEYPLSQKGDVETLVEANGRFFPKPRLLQLLKEGAVKKEHLEREIRAQVEWCFDTYGAPTHINAHHHMQIHPDIAAVIIPIMGRYGIRCVRIPDETPLPPFGYEVPAAQLTWVAAVSEEARAARVLYEAEGIASTNHFRGLALHGNASVKNLKHVLNKLPEGITELAVHPGSQTAYGTEFDLDPQRQTELNMLLDETIPELLQERKIELCSFEDL